jgi:hypothetical protein
MKSFSKTMMAVIIFGYLAVMPFFSYAVEQTGPKGIVPCGTEIKKEKIPQYNSKTGVPEMVEVESIANKCDFDYIIAGVNTIIDFFFAVSVPITIIILAYAGFLYLTSAGNVSQMDSAKKMIWPVMKGFLLIFTAWLIVSFLVKGLAEDNVTKYIFDTFFKDHP